MCCGGSISASGRRSVPFVVPGTYRIFGPHYAWKPRSRPDRVHPEIIARNHSGLPLSAPLAVGPSIILTGLYFRGDPHQCQRPELCHADPPAGNSMEFQSRGCWPYSGWVYRRDGVEAAAQGEPGPEGLLSMSESVINR